MRKGFVMRMPRFATTLDLAAGSFYMFYSHLFNLL